MNRRVLAACAAGALALSLTACANEETTTATDAAATTEATGAAEATVNNTDATAADIEFLDAAVRAKQAADTPEGSEMTAIFGTLQNNTDEDIEVTGFSSSLGDASYEIHEVVDGVMQQKEGGIVIPAGESHELKPGADHFMVMDYAPEIPAGDTVTVTLELADGSTVEIADVAVRTMLPGDESYGEDGELQGHQSEKDHNMDHSEHKH